MKYKPKGNNQKERIEHLFQSYFSEIVTADVSFLVQLVDLFRPKKNIENYNKIEITPLIDLLSANEVYRSIFSDYLKKLLFEKDFDYIITDVAIIRDSDFSSEIKKRIFNKFLPPQPSKDNLQFILNQVFHLSSDPEWIDKIPVYQLIELMSICNLNSIYQTNGKMNHAISEILYGLEVLVHRIIGKAMENDVSRMMPEYRNFDSPFIAFQREFIELSEKITQSQQRFIRSDDLNYKQILILYKQCDTYITNAFNNSSKYGISLKANQSMLRIRQQLERFKEILSFLVMDDENNTKSKTIELSKDLIKYNCGKSNVTKLIKQSTQSLAFEITQHTAKTGEHYITNSVREYYKMFWTASGGGLIVAFLCIFKVLLAKVDASEFGHAFYYSMNYSLGFIAIYLCGFTLATKQPAMTASALASALVPNKNNASEDKYRTFALLFARVFRSQFIAFVGNVMIAFPIALLLIWGIDQIFHYNIAETKWQKLLIDLSPIHSKAIFHAAIAGCFLFISGIIAGSVANQDKFNHIYYRIQENPLLKRTLGKHRTTKLSKFYEKKGAGIISNFWFGIFMGSTASIGAFLGLDLDIRHITFASGNLALGIYGGDWDVPLKMILWGIFGIGVIGFVNFIVSFTLSLTLALRSRNISLTELRKISSSIWKYFKKHPFTFFFPFKTN